MQRCAWLTDDQIYRDYHDYEWGRPVYDDNQLYAKLCLEGAQAGLNWLTILKKRDRYYQLFDRLKPDKVAVLPDAVLERNLADPGIIRNRAKVYSMRSNARAFLKIQAEFGSFSSYLWAWVDHKPIHNHPQRVKDIPTKTALSEALAKDLKRRGFSFVGSTIMYAYLQSMGLVIDHTTDCWCYREN